MNTIASLPEITGQKVTLLKKSALGFFEALPVVIEKQGESFYCGANAPFIIFTVGKMKSIYMLSITNDTVLAIFSGHLNINTNPNDAKTGGMCDLGLGFSASHFDTILKSISNSPIFVNQ